MWIQVDSYIQSRPENFSGVIEVHQDERGMGVCRLSCPWGGGQPDAWEGLK